MQVFQKHEVDLSLIHHIWMICCSYKNSQLTFLSEQRERTPKIRESGNSSFKWRTKKAHSRHTIRYPQFNSPMVRPSSARVEIKSQWELVVRLQSLQTAFLHDVFTAVKNIFCCYVVLRKILVGCAQLSNYHPLITRDVSDGSAWIVCHITTQHKGMNRTGSWTVGVDSLGRAGSSYHTATMAASRNIMDGFALCARKPHCGGRLLLVEVKTKPVRLEDGVSNWCCIRFAPLLKESKMRGWVCVAAIQPNLFLLLC